MVDGARGLGRGDRADELRKVIQLFREMSLSRIKGTCEILGSGDQRWRRDIVVAMNKSTWRPH